MLLAVPVDDQLREAVPGDRAAVVGPADRIRDPLRGPVARGVDGGLAQIEGRLHPEVERGDLDRVPVRALDRAAREADAVVPGLAPDPGDGDPERRHPPDDRLVVEVLDGELLLGDLDRASVREAQRGQQRVGGLLLADDRRHGPLVGLVEGEHGQHQLGAVVEVHEDELPRHPGVVVLDVAGMELRSLGEREPGVEVLRRGVVLADHQHPRPLRVHRLAQDRAIRLLDLERPRRVRAACMYWYEREG